MEASEQDNAVEGGAIFIFPSLTSESVSQLNLGTSTLLLLSRRETDTKTQLNWIERKNERLSDSNRQQQFHFFSNTRKTELLFIYFISTRNFTFILANSLTRYRYTYGKIIGSTSSSFPSSPTTSRQVGFRQNRRSCALCIASCEVCPADRIVLLSVVAVRRSPHRQQQYAICLSLQLSKRSCSKNAAP